MGDLTNVKSEKRKMKAIINIEKEYIRRVGIPWERYIGVRMLERQKEKAPPSYCKLRHFNDWKGEIGMKGMMVRIEVDDSERKNTYCTLFIFPSLLVLWFFNSETAALWICRLRFVISCAYQINNTTSIQCNLDT